MELNNLLIYLQIFTIILVVFIWILVAQNALRLRKENKKIYREKLQENIAKAFSVAKAKILPESPIALYQYKGYVVKTEQIKGVWKYTVFSNDMKTKILNGTSLDDRSLVRLREDLELNIDEYLKTHDKSTGTS